MRSTINLFPVPLRGKVDQAITSSQGRIKCQGSYWPARLYNANQQSILSPGQVATIIGIQGITMLVLPNEVNI